ncbi:unnamed protein product [Rangifer tarandus platyrhynchus]|uniref:Uncharacterized protein n=1 Tax=Rangifer tarandus platyrhynchus TaxID=3082113 RepID=A0AC59YNV1_RANTA
MPGSQWESNLMGTFFSTHISDFISSFNAGGSRGSDEGISLTEVSQPESSKMKTGKHLLLVAAWKADLRCPVLQLPAAVTQKRRLICIRVSWPRDTPDLKDLAREKCELSQ